jgi:4-aminobutyrate aminotransferase-like enzyme
MTKRSAQRPTQQSIPNGHPADSLRINRGIAELSPVLVQATPLVIETGRGSYLYDRDGKEYLDFTAGIGVTSTGHCPESSRRPSGKSGA